MYLLFYSIVLLLNMQCSENIQKFKVGDVRLQISTNVRHNDRIKF